MAIVIPQAAATVARAAAPVVVPVVQEQASKLLAGQVEKRLKGKCVPCFSPAVKDAIRSVVGDPDILQLLDSLPECEGRLPFNLCVKTKRAPSEYQSHISQCMKAKNIKGKGNAAPAMKECAAEWRRRKGG